MPIALSGPLTLAAGETREFPFELPVPALGPATFQGTELRVEWTLEANLDVRGFDPCGRDAGPSSSNRRRSCAPGW